MAPDHQEQMKIQGNVGGDDDVAPVKDGKSTVSEANKVVNLERNNSNSGKKSALIKFMKR